MTPNKGSGPPIWGNCLYICILWSYGIKFKSEYGRGEIENIETIYLFKNDRLREPTAQMSTVTFDCAYSTI